jgi:integrase
MPRPPKGEVLERQRTRGTVFALRFRVDGRRAFETLGTAEEGWDRERAEEALKDRLAQARLGLYRPSSTAASEPQEAAEPTFHEFASRWFEAIGPELRDSTAEAYRWHLTHHLLPFFRQHRLSEITIEEVDRYRQHKVRERDLLRARRAAGEDIGCRPLSNETINKTIVRLGQILDLGVEYRHIAANPARGKRRKLKVDRPRRSYLDTAGQIAALLDGAGERDREARGDRQHIARRTTLATFIFAGLRLGELLELRWRDVDLANGWLYVGKSKTDAGSRRVKIRPALRDALLELKARAGNPRPTAYVFATANGHKQSAGNVRNRVFAKAVERANEQLEEAGEAPLPERLTPHSLRRTFASLLYAIGEPPPVVMAELGHTDPALALRIYAQAMRRDKAEEARLRALTDGADISPGETLAERPLRAYRVRSLDSGVEEEL